MREYKKIMEGLVKKVKGEIPEPNRSLILGFIEEDKAKGISIGRSS